MSKMKVLKEHKFTADLCYEGSFGSRPAGDGIESTITVWGYDDDPRFIEWDIPALDTTEEIGLEIEGKSVVGYDGTMCLPEEACNLLESMGYDCSEVR